MVEFVGWVLVGLLVFGAAVSAGLSAYTWLRTMGLIRIPFAGLTATAALWELTFVVSLVTVDPGIRFPLEGVYVVGAGFIGVWWVVFGLAYAGQIDSITPRVFALLSVPTTTVGVAVVLEPTGSLLWTAETATVAGLTVVRRVDLTVGYIAYVAYFYMLVVAGMLLVVRRVQSVGSLYARQTVWLVLGAVPPAIGGVVDVTVSTAVDGLQLVPFVVPLTLSAFAVALFRHDMVDLAPGTGRVGRETALRDLADPVVVTDGDGQVADLNRAAEETFDVARGDAVGRSLAPLVGLDDGTALTGGGVVSLRTVGGRRHFEVSESAVLGADDSPVGRSLVFRDVTRRRLREQRLEVLNRVLRHNLRNDMNAVAGYADMLVPHVGSGTDGTDVDGESHLEEIRAVSRELVVLGEKVRTFERAIATESGLTRLRVAPTLEWIADTTAAGYDGEVTVEAPADLSFVTDEAVLEVVVENAVENALEHAGAAPTVRVEARREGAGVVVVVSDDGPGIPAGERRTVESGSETPLEHGSGLGLWIIAWGTEWLGGSVTLDDEDGTVVTLQIPDQGETTPTVAGSTAARVDQPRDGTDGSIPPSDAGGDDAPR